MFLDGLPRNYNYHKLFDVFLFYIEQSKERVWLNKDYSESERRGYIKEEIARVRENLSKGRAKQTEYIKKVQKSPEEYKKLVSGSGNATRLGVAEQRREEIVTSEWIVEKTVESNFMESKRVARTTGSEMTGNATVQNYSPIQSNLIEDLDKVIKHKDFTPDAKKTKEVYLPSKAYLQNEYQTQSNHKYSNKKTSQDEVSRKSSTKGKSSNKVGKRSQKK